VKKNFRPSRFAQQPVRIARQVGASGGTKLVVFTVDEYTDAVIDEETDEVTEPGFATCTVRYTPCGGSVPGRDSYGKIIVYDPMGCMFNEEAADLVDRWGHAAWMKPTDEEAAETGEADGYGEYAADCRWVVLGLCCPPE